MTAAVLSPEELRDLLHYDPVTGVFTRHKNAGGGSQKAGMPITCCEPAGYIVVMLKRRTYKVHRLAFLYMAGRWPAADVDHVNLIRTDNRWANLREATRSQNQANGKTGRRSSTGVKGVSFHKNTKRFTSHIRVNYKLLWVGSFSTLEEASLAYRQAAEKHFGIFANQ